MWIPPLGVKEYWSRYNEEAKGSVAFQGDWYGCTTISKEPFWCLQNHSGVSYLVKITVLVKV